MGKQMNKREQTQVELLCTQQVFELYKQITHSRIECDMLTSFVPTAISRCSNAAYHIFGHIDNDRLLEAHAKFYGEVIANSILQAHIDNEANK